MSWDSIRTGPPSTFSSLPRPYLLSQKYVLRRKTVTGTVILSRRHLHKLKYSVVTVLNLERLSDIEVLYKNLSKIEVSIY